MLKPMMTVPTTLLVYTGTACAAGPTALARARPAADVKVGALANVEAASTRAAVPAQKKDAKAPGDVTQRYNAQGFPVSRTGELVFDN
jgi:hypothetical protein